MIRVNEAMKVSGQKICRLFYDGAGNGVPELELLRGRRGAQWLGGGDTNESINE